ncbi:MAG: hypothetical protein OXN79_06475, partial [bacterium]|nr:hypothetical protein [bacterium]
MEGRDWLRVTIIDDDAPPPTPEANADGTFTVPAVWPLVPEELREIGGEFRLLFLTHDRHPFKTANPADGLAPFDAIVQASARGGHEAHRAIRPYADHFRVVGSTTAVAARDHIGLHAANPDYHDVPVYWMNGARVAVDSAGFWSEEWENWDTADQRTAASVSDSDFGIRGRQYFTGTKRNGRSYNASFALQAGGVARTGRPKDYPGSGHEPIDSGTSTSHQPLLGISPVFRVEHRPRLEIDSSGMVVGRLGDDRRQQMLVVDEPAACATAPNDVSELGGVAHPSDLVTYRVRLFADPGSEVKLYVYNPKYVVYRQGSLAKGPADSDHAYLPFREEIAFSNFYRRGVTVRPPGEDTTYAVSGGPPVNTYITLGFDSSNWDQWQTVSVNVHCADHEDHNAYIIQHELTLPGDRHSTYRATEDRRFVADFTTWHDVRVKVLDTKSPQQPADLTVDTAYPGRLRVETDGYMLNRCQGRSPDSQCEWFFGVEWDWDVPGTTNENDFLHASEHFSEFRVRLEGDQSVSPPLPVYEFSKASDDVWRFDTNNNIEPYIQYFSRTGLTHAFSSRQNPGDPVYRITVTPVTIRYDEVPGEAVTVCVQLQSPSALPSNKFSAVVDCSLFTAPSTAPPLIRAKMSAQDGEPPPQTLAEVIAEVKALAAQTHHGADHVNRWRRALAGLGAL